MPDLCTAVTERASAASPCAEPGCGAGKQDLVHHYEMLNRPSHDWLGPVLARCGHTLHCWVHRNDNYDMDCPGIQIEIEVHEFTDGD